MSDLSLATESQPVVTTELAPSARASELRSQGFAHESERTQLQARYSEIAQLVGGLAHEIRNPLSTMGLNLDLLAEEFPNPETTRDRRVLQKIERVRKETKRLEDILEDFLRFARVQELQRTSVDLNAVVDDLRDFCEPQCLTQGIVLRVQYEENMPAVDLDVDLFKQALLNLLLNAQKAMPEGGDLMLRTRMDHGQATLDIIDTGCGMDEETLSKAFNPFFSTRKGGSGLGLPTTRKIIEAHGGSIDVRSEVGRGSQFTVRLPVTLSTEPVGQGA